MTPTDEELVAAANSGDASAFEALYERHREWVLGVAMRFTGNRELAEDAMQETFVYLLRKFPGFRLTAKLRTFLYPAVRHIALALRSKRKAIDGGSAILNEQAARADVPADLAALNQALQLLDAGQREVLMLRFADDLSLQEIAEAMALPLGTVKSRLHYALQTLREHSKLRDYFS